MYFFAILPLCYMSENHNHLRQYEIYLFEVIANVKYDLICSTHNM